MGFLGSKPKAQPIFSAPVVEDTPSQKAIKKEKKSKQSAILANAGSSGAQSIGGGSPNVTTKTLLGL